MRVNVSTHSRTETYEFHAERVVDDRLSRRLRVRSTHPSARARRSPPAVPAPRPTLRPPSTARANPGQSTVDVSPGHRLPPRPRARIHPIDVHVVLSLIGDETNRSDARASIATPRRSRRAPRSRRTIPGVRSHPPSSSPVSRAGPARDRAKVGSHEAATPSTSRASMPSTFISFFF